MPNTIDMQEQNKRESALTMIHAKKDYKDGQAEAVGGQSGMET